MQKAADTHQFAEFEIDAPRKAVFELGNGDVGGLCDAGDVRACLAHREADSSGDADSGVQPVHIGRLHAVTGCRNPLAEVFLSISEDWASKLISMRSDQPAISRIASDVLTGYYKRKRKTQEELAAQAEIPLTSLQKKLAGRAPITATDFVMLSLAIGVDPVDVMAEVMKEYETAERLASEGVASLADHRRKKPSEMTEEELDAFEGESAANTDPEIGFDEPDAP